MLSEQVIDKYQDAAADVIRQAGTDLTTHVGEKIALAMKELMNFLAVPMVAVAVWGVLVLVLLWRIGSKIGKPRRRDGR